MPHPLDADGTTDLFGQERRLETRVVGGRAAVQLGTVHPDDPHLLPRHTEEFGDTRPQAVRLHVVGVDRHLSVRRIGQAVGRTDRRVSLEREVVLRFDDRRRRRQRIGGVALFLGQGNGARARGSGEGHRGHPTQVPEEFLGRRERRGRWLLPLHLEQTRRFDGLFFTFTDDRDVVSPAHDSDEPRDVPDRQLVDADQPCARYRRPDVARMDHVRKPDVHGPLKRSIDLRGDIRTEEAADRRSLSPAPA